ERLLAETLRVLVVGPQLQQLVAEDGDAARLDADERDAGADLLPQRGDRALEVTTCEPEEAVVVQRPPAADPASRNLHVEAGVLELRDGGHPDFGLEVVRERVGPEEDAPAAGARLTRGEPRLEALPREGGQPAASVRSCSSLCDRRQPRRLGEGVGERRSA